MTDYRAMISERLRDLDTDAARHLEIVEELAQHLEDCESAALARGLDADAARAAALAELRDARLLESALRDTLARAPAPEPPIGVAAPRHRLAAFWFDLRQAARALRKSPGYLLIATLTLALGIGASTAIFSVMDAVMMRELPYADSARLARIWEANAARGWTQFSFSQPNYLDFAKRTRSFESFAAVAGQRVTLTGQGAADVLAARAVSRNFLSTLDVKPALGRDFTAEEDTPGGDTKVAVLAHGFWLKAFGGRPDAVGSSLVLDGVKHRVIGVLPASFEWGDNLALLRPLAADPAAGRSDHRLSVIGRLAPGATIETARAELATIAADLGRSYPETNGGWSVTVMSFYDWLVPADTRQALLVLAAAVALLLLVACGNVANLMLARANARRRELAVRAAVGAQRGRLVAFLLAEALLLALLAGGFGALLAGFALKPLAAAAAEALPRAETIAFGARGFVFAVFASLASGALFGSIAALRASRPNLNLALRDGAQGGGVESRRLRGALVLAEMAVSVALLIGGGLLLRSFEKLQSIDPGFDTANTLVASLALPPQSYATPEAKAQFYRRVLENARALPGVRAVALSSIVPFTEGDTSTELKVPGWDRPVDAGPPSASWRLVSPGYFAALGVPLRGSDFDPNERAGGKPTLIINERMAKLYWPNQDAIGHTVVLSSLSPEPLTVIGVSGDVRTFGLEREPPAMIFASTLVISGWSPMQFVVRGALDAEAQAAAVRGLLARTDPDVALFDIETVEQRLSNTLAPRRLNLVVLASFAAAALLLAAVGLGGVMAYLVSMRQRELGIRLALGAEARSIFALVVGQGMRLALGGALLGILGALLLARGLQALLFGVSPYDMLTFTLVPALLLVVALGACWIPARRAARVDPNVVLRDG